MSSFGLYKALKDEGFELPPECGDITLELPVDGVIRLNCPLMLTGERLAQLGRALTKMAEAQS
jgi:hypothetical protein